MGRKRRRRRRGPSGNWKFVLGVIIGVLPALILGSPAAGHAKGSLDSEPVSDEVRSSEALYLESDDAVFMSRIFNERDNEIAYCGSLEEGEMGPILSVWLADTVSASSDSIEFSTANCPPEMNDVLLHTHPSGNLGLSQLDRQMIENRPESITCVQGGPLDGTTGEELENVACYRQNDPNRATLNLTRIPVVHGDSGGS